MYRQQVRAVFAGIFLVSAFRFISPTPTLTPLSETIHYRLGYGLEEALSVCVHHHEKSTIFQREIIFLTSCLLFWTMQCVQKIFP